MSQISDRIFTEGERDEDVEADMDDNSGERDLLDEWNDHEQGYLDEVAEN